MKTKEDINKRIRDLKLEEEQCLINLIDRTSDYIKLARVRGQIASLNWVKR